MGIISGISKALGVNQVITSTSAGILVMVINLLMSKFKIKSKIMSWSDKVEIHWNTWLNKVTAGFNVICYNFGVWITGFFNNTKYIKKIWEHAIEPIFICLLQLLKALILLTFEKLITLVTSGVRRLIEGLKSDNTKYEKKNGN